MMGGPYPNTLPELLEVLEQLYKREGHKLRNADMLRHSIEFLLRILHK